MRWLDGITYAMDKNLGNLWEMVGDRNPSVLQSRGVAKRVLVTEQQNTSLCHQARPRWKKSVSLELLSIL